MIPSLEQLHEALTSPRLLHRRGVRDVPFFILPFPPEAANEVARLRVRLVRRLADQGVSILELDLYDLAIEILRSRDLWTRILEREEGLGKDRLGELLRGVLDPERHLAPAISERISTNHEADVVFLSGVGEVYPFVRAHSLLANLERAATDKPLLLFFPGEFAPSNAGASLRLFNLLGDDRYYRAADIRRFQS